VYLLENVGKANLINGMISFLKKVLKKVKNYRIFSIMIIILSFFTATTLGKRTLKRYLPATLVMSLIVILESIIAKKRVWWWFYEKLHPKVPGEFPLIFGPFFIGSLIILKATYGKFLRYFLLNTMIHLLFVPIITLLKRFGISSLVRINRIQLFFLFFTKSMMMYITQMVIDRIRREGQVSNNRNNDSHIS
jgi:hypothetical protein